MTSPEAIALEGEVLRRAFSCFPSGVTAVCGLVDGEPVGMAASSFTSVSLDPPLVLVCVANESATWERLRTVGRLGVSILSADHHAVVRQLAARQGDRFAGVQWTLTDNGALILDGASAWLDCEIHEVVPAGDHLVVLLRIHALEADPAVAPLVFHSSGFRQLAEAVADNP